MGYKKFKTVIILAVMGTLCIYGCHTSVPGSNHQETGSGYMKISAEEAKNIMDSTDDFVLVDVREPDEYADGHIEDALLIPYGEIGERAETELPDKEQTILVYCRSGRRSAIAAQTLTDLGYTDIRDFGGIIDWPYDKIAD
ncbi:MAG: rhodanese-like domain-containing protein [Lachnospiraceae bacterium]|nr:rhodanese-like domain-containing protein [Lachnospiraceae bacterium]